MLEKPNTIYEDFILHLRICEKEYREAGKLSGLPKTHPKYEKHRIHPGHAGGEYTLSNTVYCTFQNHCLAHYYRFLGYGSKNDYKAWKLMISMPEKERRDMASLGGKIGGVISNQANKDQGKLFYSAEWQKLYGDRGGGQRNVGSGSLARLNREIDENRPELRSQAGRIGGKKVTHQNRETKKGFFDPDKRIQHKGNLVRWGRVIDNVRIPYDQLTPEQIEEGIFIAISKAEAKAQAQDKSLSLKEDVKKKISLNSKSNKKKSKKRFQ